MKKIQLLLVGALMVIAQMASAITITPSYDTFGALPQATFGGSGIPNSSVAITTTTVGQHTVTMGLTAHQRYNNPPLGNDGAGTFFGYVGGDAGNGQAGYATFNFAYHYEVSPGMTLAEAASLGMETRLYYDLNPASGNDVATFLTLVPSAFVPGVSSANSVNNGMTFLGGGFDPNVPGVYDYALVQLIHGQETSRTAIRVITSASVPDAGNNVLMLGFGLAGLGIFGARLRKI